MFQKLKRSLAELLPFTDNQNCREKTKCSSPINVGSRNACIKESLREYQIVSLLGRGGFSKVYEVERSRTGVKHAMKVVEKRRLLDKGRFQDCFAEKEILSQIDHPFIVKLEYTMQSDELLFFFLEYVEGGTLASYIPLLPSQRLSRLLTQWYAAEMFLALSCLHSHGVIYRDLKPHNILMDGQGHLRLADMGLSKIVGRLNGGEGAQVMYNCGDSGLISPSTSEVSEGRPEEHRQLNRCSSLVGSAMFVAPDVLSKEPYGVSVDWWALGVLVFIMGTGKYPFAAINRKELFHVIVNSQPDYERYPYLPAVTVTFLKGLLAKNEQNRLSESQIKTHIYFDGIRWSEVIAREKRPPEYRPLSTLPTGPSKTKSASSQACNSGKKASAHRYPAATLLNESSLPSFSSIDSEGVSTKGRFKFPSFLRSSRSRPESPKPPNSAKVSASGAARSGKKDSRGGRSLTPCEQKLFEGFDTAFSGGSSCGAYISHFRLHSTPSVVSSAQGLSPVPSITIV